MEGQAQFCRSQPKYAEEEKHPCSLPEDSSELVRRPGLLRFATAAFIQQDTGSPQHHHPKLVGLDRRGGITIFLLSLMMKRPRVHYRKEALSYLLSRAS